MNSPFNWNSTTIGPRILIKAMQFLQFSPSALLYYTYDLVFAAPIATNSTEIALETDAIGSQGIHRRCCSIQDGHGYVKSLGMDRMSGDSKKCTSFSTRSNVNTSK